MKRKLNIRITVLLVTALLLSALPMTAFAENEYKITQMSAQGEIISDVNVRSGPGTDYEKIGAVREKEIVAITGVSADGWYQIEYDGAEGFIYGEYVTVVEAPQEEPEEAGTEERGEISDPEETGSDEEEVKTTHSISGILKPIAVVMIIAVIVIMIFLTIRSLRQADDSEREDDYDDVDDNYYGDDDDGDYNEEDDDYNEEDDDYNEEDDDDEEEETIVKTVKADPQTIIIREEDYQLHIDPKYFEDEPITQPEFVTGYLKEMQEQQKETENHKTHSGDLQKAMDKLQELEEEIEKLKKNR